MAGKGGRIEPRVVRYGGALFDEDEIALVNAQLNDPAGLVPGAKVAEFEARVAAYMGKQHGVMVNSGSSALMIAMRLANLPLGSEVITPTLTFSSDVACIYHVGCTPVFLDVGLDDYQVRVDQIEDVITEETRAILIPDLVGGICDWDRVREIADKHDLFVIHDSADTLGGKLRGIGTRRQRADVSITSLLDLPHHHRARERRHGLLRRRCKLPRPRAGAARVGTLLREVDARHPQAGRIATAASSRNSTASSTTASSSSRRTPTASFPNECGAAFGIGQMNKIDKLWADAGGALCNWHTEFLRKHEDQFILPHHHRGHRDDLALLSAAAAARVGAGAVASCQIQLEDSGITSRVIFSGNITRHPMLSGYEYRVHPDGLGACRPDHAARHHAALPSDYDARGLRIPLPGDRRLHCGGWRSLRDAAAATARSVMPTG